MAERVIKVERKEEDEEYLVHIRRPSLSVLPDPTREHLRASEKEVLLALRTIVDRAIDGVEKRGKRGRRAHPTTIQVE